MENTSKKNVNTEEYRAKRAKRRRRNKALTVAGLSGCLILLAVIICLGVRLWKGANRSEEVSAEVEEITYTQAQLDARLQEAQTQADEQALQAADERQQELLSAIQISLEEGTSVVETLRPYYPGKLVLVSGGRYNFVPIREDLKHNTYDIAKLNILESGEYQYVEDGQVTSHKGIDVSAHQGKINWQKVADDGVEFAFIRVAFRGYGTGKLVEDKYFEDNIKGANKAGIKAGVYVYSQAVTEEELLEEANFVLEKIAPYKLDCPVVYDVEKVAGADGRMNNISIEERTRFAVLFCQTMENAGYQSMIYHNMEMAAMMVNLEELEPYQKWFAYYNDDFYYPYDYAVWQYSEKGQVNGVEGNVDLNISFRPLWQ